MQTSSDYQNGKSQPSAGTTDTQRPTDSLPRGYESEKRQPDEVYLGMVHKLVLKSISLSNSPTLTTPEQVQRRDDWAEALFPVIPEGKLNQAFQKAVHDHKGGFPISAYEVLNAYELLVANPDVNRPPSAGALPEAESEVQKRLNCQRCLGTGQLHIIDIDGTVVGVKPPGSCDHSPLREGEAGLFKPSGNVARIER